MIEHNSMREIDERKRERDVHCTYLRSGKLDLPSWRMLEGEKKALR